jgi:hypothetical protein
MATVAGLGEMAINPANQSPSLPGSVGASSNLGGGGTQQNLGALSQGSQAFTDAVDQASSALDTLNSGVSTAPSGMKKGGSVRAKSNAKTWHGFNKSVTGNNKHGF